MKLMQNLVEMWQQRGSNRHNTIVNSNPNDCCNGNCNQGRDCHSRKERKLTKNSDNLIKLFCAVGIAFTVGVGFGQLVLKKAIVDDCRILRATRFGEVYIGCGTAQKL